MQISKKSKLFFSQSELNTVHEIYHSVLCPGGQSVGSGYVRLYKLLWADLCMLLHELGRSFSSTRATKIKEKRRQ